MQHDLPKRNRIPDNSRFRNMCIVPRSDAPPAIQPNTARTSAANVNSSNSPKHEDDVCRCCGSDAGDYCTCHEDPMP